MLVKYSELLLRLKHRFAVVGQRFGAWGESFGEDQWGLGGEGVGEAAEAVGGGVFGQGGGDEQAVVFVEGNQPPVEGTVVEGVEA